MFNRKIKICHIVTVDITVRYLLMPQLQFLRGEGYDVHVVCSPGKLTKEIEAEGVKVKSIKITRNISPFADLVSLWKLFLYFKKEKFDIVHTHGPKAALLGQLAAKLAGVPIIIGTVHGLYFTESSSPAKRLFFITMKKIASSCAALIFSQNREDIETLVREKIAKLQKVKYLGNGIDIEKFNPEKFSSDFILQKKKELGISPNVKVIGTVGRLVKEKGYFDLFEAMKIVLKKHPNALLLVIGPEEPEKKDKFSPSIVKEFGIENNVVFLGERGDVQELYPLMDVFVLASHREGFPRSVIEAMAMERPIVVTNIRGCREEINDGENGLMVPPKNYEKLAEAITFLLENKEKANVFARKARARAVKEFDEHLVFSKVGGEYKRLLEEKIYSTTLKDSVLSMTKGVRRLKVCHVTTVDVTVRFILWNVLDFLKKENYDVSVVCSPGVWTPLIKSQGFSFYGVKMLRRISPFSDLVPLAKLFFYFKKEKFDIVHTHTPKAGVLGRIAARLAGVPIVVHSSHGFYTGIPMDPGVKWTILSAEKIAAYFCDLVTSQNKEDVEFAVKTQLINPKKIKLLTYGIDISRFNASKFSSEYILNKKKELGLAQKKVIGMVGRFVEGKGYLDLFEAFKIVREKMKNVVLLLVAPMDKEKDDALDKSILDEYGIKKDTVLLGYQKEITNIEEIYPLMDVFTLPSFREGFPFSIMEASASSLSVVATDVRGCREAVEDGVTGILVPLHKPQKLAEALIYFLQNSDKALEMGKNGRKKAEKEFDERLAFAKIKETYEHLLSTKK